LFLRTLLFTLFPYTTLFRSQISDGSVVYAAMEGSRPLLVEVQALVNPTSYGYPKRTASGIDLNRVNLLIAVLERRTKLKLADREDRKSTRLNSSHVAISYAV